MPSSALPVLLVVWLAGLFLLLPSTATPLPPPGAVEKVPGTGVAATVNGVAITEAQVSEMLGQMLPAGAFHREITPEREKNLRSEALEKLIEAELMYQEAAGLGITVSSEEVRKALDGQKAHFKSEADFQAFLKKERMTETEYEGRIQRTMVLNRVVRQEVDEPSRVSEGEVRTYYDNNKARFVEPEQIRLNEIFIYVPPALDGETKAKKRQTAQEVLAKLRAGEDFCKLAEEYSDDDLKDRCGDTGFAHKGMLDETLEKEVWKMKSGDIGTVTLEKGIMIMKIGDHRPEHQLSFDGIRDRLRREVAEKKRKGIAEEFIRGLRTKAKIVLYEK